jgi:hypothetical protein
MMACTFPVMGTVLQLVIKRLWLGIGQRPDMNMLIGVLVLFFLTGFLFALGFFLIRPYLPGKNPAAKSLYYGALIGAGIYFPNIVNFIAFDPSHSMDLFSPFKIEQYVTAGNDLINFLINGLILGFVTIRMEGARAESGTTAPLRYGPSIAGMVSLPAIGFLIWILFTPVFQVGYLIPAGHEVWFHLIFWIPLSIACGISIPILYQYYAPMFLGNWIINAFLFACIHFLMYWVTMTLFVIPTAGMNIIEAGFFFVIAFAMILAASLPAAWALRNRTAPLDAPA